MTEATINENNSRRFRVTIIKKIPDPEGKKGTEWYRYVIDHESSKIEGKRSGTFESVKQYAEEYADTLNQRSLFGYSSYSTRKEKK